MSYKRCCYCGDPTDGAGYDPELEDWVCQECAEDDAAWDDGEVDAS